MDILHLIDRLEELFNHSRHIPLTNESIVNEDHFLELVDQLRVTIPEEVKKAQQVLAQRDRLLAQAQEEAQRTVELARSEADVLRRDADDYVMESLSKIETEMTTLLNQVRNGISKLNAERSLVSHPAERPHD
jgi:type II secretory pathway predicted ATPase ExeA